MGDPTNPPEPILTIFPIAIIADEQWTDSKGAGAGRPVVDAMGLVVQVTWVYPHLLRARQAASLQTKPNRRRLHGTRHSTLISELYR